MNLIVRGRDVQRHEKIMKALFKIRYENFIVRRNWAMPSKDGMDIDQYDNENTVYFMVLDQEEDILTSARITHTVENSLLADLFPFLIESGESPRGQHLYEGTRFTLSPKLASRAAVRNARAALGTAIVNWIREQGGTQLQAVVEATAFPAFLAMSMRTRVLGLARDYGGGKGVPGGGRCIAFRWDLSDELLDDFWDYARGTDVDADAAIH